MVVTEQLVFEALHGDGEVDDGHPRRELGREVGVGQARGEEEQEGVTVVELLSNTEARRPAKAAGCFGRGGVLKTRARRG